MVYRIFNESFAEDISKMPSLKQLKIECAKYLLNTINDKKLAKQFLLKTDSNDIIVNDLISDEDNFKELSLNYFKSNNSFKVGSNKRSKQESLQIKVTIYISQNKKSDLPSLIRNSFIEITIKLHIPTQTVTNSNFEFNRRINLFKFLSDFDNHDWKNVFNDAIYDFKRQLNIDINKSEYIVDIDTLAKYFNVKDKNIFEDIFENLLKNDKDDKPYGYESFSQLVSKEIKKFTATNSETKRAKQQDLFDMLNENNLTKGKPSLFDTNDTNIQYKNMKSLCDILVHYEP